MRTDMIVVLLLFGLLSWRPASAGAFAGAAHAQSPKDLRIDSLRLGAPIERFETQWARTLCDRDPIDGKTKTVWFHAPSPCRTAEALPGKTVVVLYTKTKSATDPLDAIAWFGDWPTEGGNFPLKVGVSKREAEAALGPAQRLFDFAGLIVEGEKLVVWRHASGYYSITIAPDDVLVKSGAEPKVFGYVAGAMSDSPSREDWCGLVANVRRYRK